MEGWRFVMNKQEIFNTVVTHLRTQATPAMEDGECRYRAQEDDSILKCAVGCLIEDKFYEEHLESDDSFSPKVIMAVAKSLNIEETDVPDELLNKLQSCHDYHSPEEWENRFKTIARSENLTVPPLPM